MLVKLVSAYVVFKGFWTAQSRIFISFANKGGVLMNSVRHEVVTTILYLTTKIYYIPIHNLN